MTRRALLFVPVAVLLAAAAGSAPGGLDPLDSPAGPGSMAPSLVSAGNDILLTWLEPLSPATPGKPPAAPAGHRLRISRLSGGRWSAPVTVASGPGFFANWADFPSVALAPDGSLTAHWLAKTGDDTYAYGIFHARSTDGGATWKEMGLLHDDRIQAEHGFVSWVAEGKGLRAFWLDGRQTAKGGPMTLRTTVLEGGTPRPSELLDDRVCDCCQTDAALAADGPVVVYRDRTAEEVRDIYVKRRTSAGTAGWSKPVRVGADKWRIPGCPVNGPAIAAAGKRVAVAWFTGAPPGPRIQVAFSADGGATFGKPVLVDGEKPLGRLDLVLDGEGNALVSWLALNEKNADLRLRRVSPAGKAEPPVTLATTSAARSGGVPRLAVAAGRLYVAWVDDSEAGRRVRVGVRNLGL
jgi:hypothetical protein